MAATPSQLNGWEIIKKDSQGRILPDDLSQRRARRRGQRQGEKEHVVIRRLQDLVEISCGDSVVMREEEVADSYSVYLVHEIRLNTMNNIVEIWAFNYLRWFEFDPKQHLVKTCRAKEMDASRISQMSPEEALDHFNKVTNKSELGLTAGLSEIYLKDFISSASILSPDEWPADGENIPFSPYRFMVRYACEPDGTSFAALDIHGLERKMLDWEAKTSYAYVKELTVTNQDKILKSYTPAFKTSDTIGARPHPLEEKTPELANQKKSSAKGAEVYGSGSESAEFQDATDDMDYVELPTETFTSKDRNIIPSKELAVRDTSSNIEDYDDGENTGNKRDSKKPDATFTPDQKVTVEEDTEEDRPLTQVKRVARSKSRSPKRRTEVEETPLPSTPRKRPNKAVGTATGGGIKKYTKKNVSRAKKAYTPFSKRFSRPEDIPDLTQLAEFNQDQIDVDAAAIESKLRSPKKQHTVETIFSKVKKQLYTSQGKDEIVKATNFEEYLPARENEFASIYLSLYSAIEAGTGTTVYVAGTPGVGKTLTVREVVKELLQSVDQDELPRFQYVEINGLKMIKPTDSYEVLWHKISGERLTSGAAMESLEFYFNKVPRNKKRPILVLLDELDALVTKSQDVMYNFFNWTTYGNAKLIVVAVANTMDLPERQLGNKVSSRIGFTRIMFTGYNYEELKTIINLRLKGLNDSYFYVDTKSGSAHIAFEDGEQPDIDTTGMQKVRLKISPDAVEIASRKIASVSGDARRALKACKRAVEIAEQDYMEKHGFAYDGKQNGTKIATQNGGDEELQKVEIAHIMKALNETVNSPVVSFIVGLSFTSKLFLYAMLNLMRKTGNHEQPLGDIVDEIRSSIEANGKNKYIVEMQRVLFNQDSELDMEQLRIISWEFLVNQLIDAGIIIKQNLKNERLSAVKFNVSTEDVKIALDQDKIMKTL
ncbi:origin recognition complex subunit 1 [Lachancea thermotolerans CBS 6340]|uniref:Origin recognition complex subunit 1 n=1 Tax=Lachancea thermotolerans (strain ATCC 56472 / CBS 6340 / NRRL Y-8284) TaxID=559295 RepID=C5DFM2_LACTC|nr:KLTH0D16258p [Lachancea thermotolerans CBS 6340]CAR22977.1 KLTH0D16258p [Lachancea thermotolerans CBS 6340]